MSHGHDTGNNPVLNLWAKSCLVLLFVMVAIFYWLQAAAFPSDPTYGALKLSLSVSLVASFLAGIIALLKRDSMRPAGTAMVTLVVFANIIFMVPVLVVI